MSVWAKIAFAVLVTALGLVVGIWLHTAVNGDERVASIGSVHKRSPRSSQPPILERKTEAPKIRPASAGLNHPRPEAPQSGSNVTDRGDAAAAATSFAALESSLGAQVGLAVAPLGGAPPQTYGGLQVGHAWSSMKVPILVTLMREGALSPEEESWASAALTASDNEAAAALFGRLEDAQGGLAGASLAVQRTLAAAGDTATQIATAPPPPGAVSTWGQTEWPLSGSVDFYRALACGELLGGSQTAQVLGLMENVIPEQQWGLGQAGFPAGTSVAYKAGWGPEAGTGAYLVRQAGIVRHGSTGVVVTMMAEDSSGAFEAGVGDVDHLADWVAEHLADLGAGSC